MGLADRAEHRPGELSGGQQQRVAVARALVTEPALILADEPTGNLDSTSSADILDMLEELNREGSTIVLITHERDIASRAERIVELRDGEIWRPRPVEDEEARVGRGGRDDVADTFRTAIEAVRTHRLRSALTMLGILIGITAVVLTVGLGQGAQAKVQDQINELGTNVLVVSPGSSTTSSGTRGGFGSASTLTRQDAQVLHSATAAPDIESVAPVSTTSAALLAGSTNWTTTLTGTTPAWRDVRSRGLSTGRFITAADEQNAADVVVLGPDTATELFGGTIQRGRPDRQLQRRQARGRRHSR